MPHTLWRTAAFNAMKTGISRECAHLKNLYENKELWVAEGHCVTFWDTFCNFRNELFSGQRIMIAQAQLDLVLISVQHSLAYL